jgi:3-hydroxyisobutyrate dehydrogenase-like beta-hydroxyacid dehydrogenase
MATRRIGIIGYGEVGAVLAAGIAANTSTAVTVFDPVLLTSVATEQLSGARALGVSIAENIDEVAACELVLSVVTPAAACQAWQDFLAAADPGRMLIDLNSTGPAQKQGLLSVAMRVGIDYVDGALVGGGIGLEGFRIPVLLAGAAADSAASALESLGMRAEVIGSDVGQAAAAKMLRVVVMKGLEGLFVEAFVAAHRHGVVDVVLRSVAETLDAFAAKELIGTMLSSHIRHCQRRAVEVDMIHDVVSSADLEPFMCSATSALFLRSVAGDLEPDDVDTSDRIASSAAILSLGIGRQGTD